MKITKQKVYCQDCKKHVEVELVMGPIMVAVAAMQAARCPLCGGKKICV